MYKAHSEFDLQLPSAGTNWHRQYASQSPASTSQSHQPLSLQHDLARLGEQHLSLYCHPSLSCFSGSRQPAIYLQRNPIAYLTTQQQLNHACTAEAELQQQRAATLPHRTAARMQPTSSPAAAGIAQDGPASQQGEHARTKRHGRVHLRDQHAEQIWLRGALLPGVLPCSVSR